MTQVIFLNGPPRVGKSFAAGILFDILGGSVARVLGFAEHLKKATHAAYGLGNIPFDHYEAVKDIPNDDFFGLTPREAYIKHSETYMKVHHGKRIFGTLWLRQAVRFPRVKHWIIPDSGFRDEADVPMEAFRPENCTLVRLHRDGCTFAKDSRSYIELPVRTVDLSNNGTATDLRNKLAAYLLEIA